LQTKVRNKKETLKSCIWNVALYGSETWTLGKNEERLINAFETWCWRRMLKIKWRDRITNDEVFKGRKNKDYGTTFRIDTKLS
jgi:hypothetical protein